MLPLWKLPTLPWYYLLCTAFWFHCTFCLTAKIVGIVYFCSIWKWASSSQENKSLKLKGVLEIRLLFENRVKYLNTYLQLIFKRVLNNVFVIVSRWPLESFWVSECSFYHYHSIKALVCQWVRLSVWMFPNSSEKPNPSELKFWGMIPLGIRKVLG